MEFAIAIVAIVIVIALVTASKGVKIIPQASVKLIERLGKFHKIARSGINFIVPFVDKDGVEEGDQGKARQPRDHNRQASYALLDVKKMEAKIMRIEYDIPKVSDEIVKAGLPDFLAERLFFGM